MNFRFTLFVVICGSWFLFKQLTMVLIGAGVLLVVLALMFLVLT
jgi:hypothetical protein